MTTTYYKYRTLDNLMFVLDILMNERLFAAPFRSLNDPMEGRYVYKRTELDEMVRKEVRENKSNLSVLSLSSTKTNPLMWAYYAFGHQGIAIGVTLKEDNAEPVQYKPNLKMLSEELHLSSPGSEENLKKLSRKILTRKLDYWQHEQEYRVLKEMNNSVNGAFVPVEIKEFIFGEKIDKDAKTLLRKLLEKIQPGIEPQEMTSAQLNFD